MTINQSMVSPIPWKMSHSRLLKGANLRYALHLKSLWWIPQTVYQIEKASSLQVQSRNLFTSKRISGIKICFEFKYFDIILTYPLVMPGSSISSTWTLLLVLIPLCICLSDGKICKHWQLTSLVQQMGEFVKVRCNPTSTLNSINDFGNYFPVFKTFFFFGLTALFRGLQLGPNQCKSTMVSPPNNSNNNNNNKTLKIQGNFCHYAKKKKDWIRYQTLKLFSHLFYFLIYLYLLL